MSKRSGMSRLEDLRHWFVDTGRYRYVLHKFDMEPWRNQRCSGCGEGFASDPRLTYSIYPMHNMDCLDRYLAANPQEDSDGD
jgi:hypothetical protein